MNNIKEFLESEYDSCISELKSSNSIIQEIECDDTKKTLDAILEKSESARGVLAVILTSIVYKIFNRNQDIRYHQANMTNGYSGRSFDSAYITPFLKDKKFPSMAESGWLTRSLEQKMPYDSKYPGSISPTELKESFIYLIDKIQFGENNLQFFRYIIQFLILQRNKHNVALAKPTNLSISEVTRTIERHFFSKYASEGASRLPSLAFYAIYQCLINEVKRFEGKTLMELENHTSADLRSGRIGDIDIIDEKKRPFEAVEIKHGIEISTQLISDSYRKFGSTPVKRYYILSTAEIKAGEHNNIKKEIENIKRIHGCQIIVNGVIMSLQYYLRLINDSFDFIEKYVNLLEKDTSIKFEHKIKWNELINSL